MTNTNDVGNPPPPPQFRCDPPTDVHPWWGVTVVLWNVPEACGMPHAVGFLRQRHRIPQYQRQSNTTPTPFPPRQRQPWGGLAAINHFSKVSSFGGQAQKNGGTGRLAFSLVLQKKTGTALPDRTTRTAAASKPNKDGGSARSRTSHSQPSQSHWEPTNSIPFEQSATCWNQQRPRVGFQNGW